MRPTYRKGFTLIELLICAAILLVISSSLMKLWVIPSREAREISSDQIAHNRMRQLLRDVSRDFRNAGNMAQEAGDFVASDGVLILADVEHIDGKNIDYLVYHNQEGQCWRTEISEQADIRASRSISPWGMTLQFDRKQNGLLDVRMLWKNPQDRKRVPPKERSFLISRRPLGARKRVTERNGLE